WRVRERLYVFNGAADVTWPRCFKHGLVCGVFCHRDLLALPLAVLAAHTPRSITVVAVCRTLMGRRGVHCHDSSHRHPGHGHFCLYLQSCIGRLLGRSLPARDSKDTRCLSHLLGIYPTFAPVAWVAGGRGDRLGFWNRRKCFIRRWWCANAPRLGLGRILAILGAAR